MTEPTYPLFINSLARDAFERLTPHIEAAMEYAGGTHTPEHIWSGILAGHFQFWPGTESVIITELHTYPTGKRDLHFFLAGGSLGELESMYKDVVEWGRKMGCTRATLAGRAGWARSFLTRKEGWEPRWSVLAKEI